jgi:hypothetical protein
MIFTYLADCVHLYDNRNAWRPVFTKLTEQLRFVRFSKGPRMTVVSKNLPSMPPRELFLEQFPVC